MVVQIFLLVFSFSLYSCQTYDDSDIRNQLNVISEHYMRLDDKLKVVSDENSALKRRLDKLEEVNGKVEKENTELRNRITSFEKLADKLDLIFKENKFIGRENIRKENEDVESIKEIFSDHPDIEKHSIKQFSKLNLANPSREGRNSEDLIPDHPDLESWQEDIDTNDGTTDQTKSQYHTLNTLSGVINNWKSFRQGRDFENLIPDHTNLEDNNEDFIKTETRFREARDFENLISDHPNSKDKNEDLINTEKRFREGRDFENLIPDHPNSKDNNEDFINNDKRFREGRDIDDLIPDYKEKQSQYEEQDKRLLAGPNIRGVSGLSTRVAFSASLSTTLALGAHQTVEYDQVLTNIGNGYDARHGHFTAPVQGGYLLSCSLLNIDTEVYLEIVKNGNRIAKFYSDSRNLNSASQTIVVALNVGDMAWVRHASTSTGNKLDGGGYNTFSGALLFEMN